MLQIAKYGDGKGDLLAFDGADYERVLMEIEQDFARLILSANKTADAQRIKEIAIELNYAGLGRYVAQMAVYVGTIPRIMGAAYNLIAAMVSRGSLFMESAIRLVCKTPSDVAGILAVYMDNYGMPIPTRLKDTLRTIFETFSEETLLEHNLAGRITLSNVVLFLYPRRSPLLELLATKGKMDRRRKGDFWKAESPVSDVTPSLIHEITEIKLDYVTTSQNAIG